MNERRRCACQVACFLGFLIIHHAVGTVRFIGAGQRYDGSSYYDSYYCCSKCGHLAWLVGSENAGTFTATMSKVGDVKREFTNHRSILFHSMLLSLRTEGKICMDSVLIVTRNNSVYKPPVICQGDDGNSKVDYSIAVGIKKMFRNVNDVSTAQISSEDNEGASRINICHSTHIANLKVPTETNDTYYVAVFNASAKEGESTFAPHSLNSTRVLYEALLLEKDDESVTSVIIWTHFNAEENLKVTCSNVTLPYNDKLATTAAVSEMPKRSWSAGVAVLVILLVAILIVVIVIICLVILRKRNLKKKIIIASATPVHFTVNGEDSTVGLNLASTPQQEADINEESCEPTTDENETGEEAMGKEEDLLDLMPNNTDLERQNSPPRFPPRSKSFEWLKDIRVHLPSKPRSRSVGFEKHTQVKEI